jgi:hypothetical protein
MNILCQEKDKKELHIIYCSRMNSLYIFLDFFLVDGKKNEKSVCELNEYQSDEYFIFNVYFSASSTEILN